MSTLSPFSLFRYLKPYWVQCTVGPLFKLAEAVLELYMPFLLAQVIGPRHCHGGLHLCPPDGVCACRYRRHRTWYGVGMPISGE